jgi:hypothetical protein
VILGSTTSIPDTIYKYEAELWLQLRVAGQLLSERTRIISTPYAVVSAYADTAEFAQSAPPDPDWFIQEPDMYSGLPGNVGIGTTTPSDSAKLHVESHRRYAGYFTSDYDSFKTHVIHAEYTGDSANAIAVYGESSPADDMGTGGLFIGGNTGVFGYASGGGDGVHYGVYGLSEIYSEGTNYGLYGAAVGIDADINYGVYACALGGLDNYAGYFDGDVNVIGYLSKGSGSFLIDHPLDPENKTLRHNFVESPENLCLYRGKVRLDNTGEAVVQLPEYFAALTKEDEATVVLTSVGRPFNTGYEWNDDHSMFTIYGESNREVSYIVLADRDDPVMHQLYRPVEEEKGNGNFTKGKLLYPEAYGFPHEKGVDYRPIKDR